MPTLQSINASASPEVQMNQNFYAVSAAALFGRKDSTTAGLTFGYYGGIIGGIGTFATIADGTVALTGSATNYIEATTAGVVSTNTTAFTAGRQPLYTAVTSSTAITTLTDYRVILPSMSTGSVTYSTLTLATGTITADTPALSITQTWNNAGVNFIAADTNVTNTASGASSMLHRWRVGGAVKASIDYLGAMVLAAGLTLGSALVGAATQAVFNTVSTTLNIGGAATAVNMGAGAASTLTASFTTAIALNTAAISSNQTTVALLATPTTVNFAQGASTALNIGHASGTNTIAGATTFNQAITAATGSMIGGNAVANATLIINGSDASNKFLEFDSAGVQKWRVYAGASTVFDFNILSTAGGSLILTQAGAATVSGALTAASLSTGSGTISGGAISGTTGTFSVAGTSGSTVTLTRETTTPQVLLETGSANAGARNWVIATNFVDYGDFAVRVGSAQGGAPDTTRLYSDNAGIITMSAYGAGTATFSAAGVISSVSDERLKIKDGAIKDPIPMLMALEPGYFYGKPEANMGDARQLGFYAQNVRKAIGPEAAPDPLEGKPWGYYDRSVLAVVVEAEKNHESRLRTLEAQK